MADKGYWYLRLKQDFFKSNEMMVLQAMTDGYLYSDILMKMYLASLEDEGRLMFRETIPYSVEMLATITGHEEEVVEEAIKQFKSLGMIDVSKNGAIYMSDIQNFIGRSSTEADRKRAFRKRMADENKDIEEKPKEKSVVEEKRAEKPKGYTTEFEEVWQEYPRHKEKSMAYKSYHARLTDGYSHEELLSATKAYAAECRKNRTDEKYIKQGKTFFGPNTPFLDYLKKNQPVEEPMNGSNPFR